MKIAGTGVKIGAAIVLIYITIGGLSSAIYDEVLQFFVILAGLLPLTIVGLVSRPIERLMVGAVRTGCSPVAAPPRSLKCPAPLPIFGGMEPLASVSFATTGGSRTAGWQMQLRVDYVVNKVMQTHRGQSEDVVARAINEQLRSFGVVPNGRQIAQYATVISQLPLLPPKTDV